MHFDAPETVVVYHRLRLREIRDLYDELNLDLDHYLGVEQKVSEGIDTLEVEFTEVRETLERVMDLSENRVEMRIPRLSWFLHDLRFPHS